MKTPVLFCVSGRPPVHVCGPFLFTRIIVAGAALRYAAYSVNRLPIPNVTTAFLIVISSLSAEGSAGEGQSSGDASSVPGSGTIATRYVSALADLDGLLSPWG